MAAIDLREDLAKLVFVLNLQISSVENMEKNVTLEADVCIA